MRNSLLFLPSLLIILTACNAQQIEVLDPTPTLPSTSTYTLTTISTPTKTPTATPIPIKYVTLGPPFHTECGIPFLVCDNSFNGPQGEIQPRYGHFDIWPSDCNPDAFDGEVIAPASGIIEKHPHSYRIIFPPDTYPENIEFALSFMGIENPDLSVVKGFSIDLGHMELLPDIKPGDFVNKGQPIGNLTKSESLFPILAYQINFWYGKNAIVGAYRPYSDFYMASPTIFKNDITYPINFEIPEDPAYNIIYLNDQGPWLFNPKVAELLGEHWTPFFNYPEPMAYP
jgi:hypothetical protein